MSTITTDLDEARRDLAAIFRWTAREGMHEAVSYTHLTLPTIE